MHDCTNLLPLYRKLRVLVALLTVITCPNRKYKRAASISKIILTLDDIVFIDTHVSKKVRPPDLELNT